MTLWLVPLLIGAELRYSYAPKFVQAWFLGTATMAILGLIARYGMDDGLALRRPEVAVARAACVGSRSSVSYRLGALLAACAERQRGSASDQYQDSLHDLLVCGQRRDGRMSSG